jgi:UDPglucose 6-dehydrogenase
MQVVRMNEHQAERFVDTMVKNMFNTIAGKRIAVLGFAFKADTGDTRESPAIRICRHLVEERADIVISDPRALANAKRELDDLGDRVRFDPDPYSALEGAHAMVLLTEWDVYKTLDFERVLRSMVRPPFVFDGRNALDHAKLEALGFNVYAVGKAARIR